MIKPDIETASVLCNKLINEILDRWAQNEHGRNYLVRRIEKDRNTIMLQPTHSEVFYYVQDFFQVATACGCRFYVDVKENQDGKMTPTLVIHK